MTIEEFKAILNDKDMQSKQTNIQVYKNGKNKITLKEFYDQFLEFAKRQEECWDKQEKFNQLILNRIDNLVKKNNLKE